ncbi:MAG: FHA domain-containing protein [Candidatus Methanomethyliaceae archaeon]
MSKEGIPTRKVWKPERSSETKLPQYHPTAPIGKEEFGSSGPEKTELLRTEPPSFAWLVMIEGSHIGQIFRLHPSSTLIGRAPNCDIVLDDPAVSRQHAKVRAVEGENKEKIFVIHDLGTENGTFVNDEEITKKELNDGDVISLGRTKFVFKQVKISQ